MADKEDKANGNGYIIVPRFPATDPQKVFHYTDLQRSKPTRANDPYEYMQGWGNRFQSEVIPGTLPAGQNNPQENRFGLYTEGITYSAFAAPRHANFSTYMYRVRPAAAHSKFPLFKHPRFPIINNNLTHLLSLSLRNLNLEYQIPNKLTDGYTPLPSPNIENCFLSLNPKVALLPQQAEWTPFPLPPASQPTDFVEGLHTLAGSGDPNIREGIALYVYTINTSMTPNRKSYCNNDGDFLLCAQQGNLVLPPLSPFLQLSFFPSFFSKGETDENRTSKLNSASSSYNQARSSSCSAASDSQSTWLPGPRAHAAT